MGHFRREYLNILLIDNYDSYSYNLVQLIAQYNNLKLPTVIFNDDPRLMPSNISGQLPFLEKYDCVILSPGPGHPANKEVIQTRR